MAYVSPAFIDQPSISRLKIQSCNECDKLRNDFCFFPLSKKRKFQEDMPLICKCNTKKCEGLIKVEFLLNNGCLIEGGCSLQDVSISMEDARKRLRTDANCTLHFCIVDGVEKKESRKSRSERSKFLCMPQETLSHA